MDFQLSFPWLSVFGVRFYWTRYRSNTFISLSCVPSMDGYFINLDVLPKLPLTLMLLSSSNYALHFFTIITVQLLLYSFLASFCDFSSRVCWNMSLVPTSAGRCRIVLLFRTRPTTTCQRDLSFVEVQSSAIWIFNHHCYVVVFQPRSL